MQTVLPKEFLNFRQHSGFNQNIKAIDAAEFFDHGRRRPNQLMTFIPIESRSETATERFRILPRFLPVLVVKRQLD